MSKKIIALLLAVVMVMGLVACGNAAEPTPTDAAAPATEPAEVETEAQPIDVSLKVWAPSEDQNPELGQWLITMCEQFNELHPEWNITFEYGVCTESEAKKLVPQDMEAAADVFLYSSTNLEVLTSSNALAEFGGKYLEAVQNNYPQSMVDCTIYDGGVYGVPMTTNTYFMYYDKSVFTEEDVKSLDVMLEKGKVAFPLANGFYNAAFYLANGATFFGADGSDREAGIQLGGENGTAVTHALVDYVANPNFIVAEPADAIAMMREGNCDAYVCGTWQAAQTEEILGENFGVAMLPTATIDGQAKQLRPFTSAKVIGVKSTTAYPEVALNLALWLGGYESQKAHYELRGYIPCELKLMSEVQDDIVCRIDAQTITEIAVPRYSFAEFSYFWTPAESMGLEIRDGVVTHENAAEKTEALNTAVNSAGI
ncbi:MAG: extracellular solute-binding protein [Oscillospiraceae bacterium]|nr:extracellular solute-binding protein [Oscillospiraceae bacterium]